MPRGGINGEGAIPNSLVQYLVSCKHKRLRVNYFFRRIPLFSRSLQWRKTKKVAITDNFSLLVAGDGFEPTTFGL